MELQIPDQIASRIRKYIVADVGQTPLEVLEKALDRLDASPSTFSQYRGMAVGWSLDQMLEDRRTGLR